MLVKLLATKPEQVGSSLKELVLYLSGHAVSVLAPEGAQTFQLNGIIPARVCWHITAYVVFNGHLGSSGVPESFKFKQPYCQVAIVGARQAFIKSARLFQK